MSRDLLSNLMNKLTFGMNDQVKVEIVEVKPIENNSSQQKEFRGIFSFDKISQTFQNLD